MTTFAKHSILGVWQSSENDSGLLKLFRRGSKSDTWECLIFTKLILVFTPNLQFPLYTWKYKIQAKEWLTKIEEKWYYLSFISFIPMSQTISVISGSDTCYFLHASNQWRVCCRVWVGSRAWKKKDCCTVDRGGCSCCNTCYSFFQYLQIEV